jgi:hypothetical protein
VAKIAKSYQEKPDCRHGVAVPVILPQSGMFSLMESPARTQPQAPRVGLFED